jgi:hypothetical protein
MSVKFKINKSIAKLRYLRRINSYNTKEIKSIAIIFYIPKTNTLKYNNWEDGFTKAVGILNTYFDVSWINLAEAKPTVETLNTFDFLIVKSCWDWIVDNYVRSLKGLKVPTGLAISCSKLPVNKNNIYAYDVLWFETNWYSELVKQHPRAFHAFGINSSVFKFKETTKEYDVLSIGQLAAYKRHENILKLKGDKKLVIGDTNTKEGAEIKNFLNANNVEVIEFMNQDNLSYYINKSKLVYIPASINGGGERAVLEARSCGAEVLVEQDNPKLKELVTSQIWDENYYADRLKTGIFSILK